ncbi:MAG: DUF1573 domain-containing protein [Bacteroidota bacterium]
MKTISTTNERRIVRLGEFARHFVIPVSFLVGFLTGTWEAPAQPRLILKPGTSVDFGSVQRGDTLRRPIKILNAGTDTLIISNVQPSCGCTATLLSDNIIPPNDSGSLEVSFDATHYKGKVTKSVTISSNDPTNPRLIFSFSVYVTVNVDVVPEYLVFANVKKGSTVSQNIKIINRSKSVLRIKSVDNRIEGLSISIFPKLIAQDSSATLKATFIGQKPGSINGIVTLHTSDREQPVVDIRVYGFVQE